MASYILGTSLRLGGTVKAVLTDGGTLEPVTGATVVVRIKPPSGESFNLDTTENTSKPGRYSAVYTCPAVGTYQWYLHSLAPVTGRMQPVRTFLIVAPPF